MDGSNTKCPTCSQPYYIYSSYHVVMATPNNCTISCEHIYQQYKIVIFILLYSPYHIKLQWTHLSGFYQTIRNYLISKSRDQQGTYDFDVFVGSIGFVLFGRNKFIHNIGLFIILNSIFCILKINVNFFCYEISFSNFNR